MFCRNCGNELKVGSKFCENCGTKVEIENNVNSEESVLPEETVVSGEYNAEETAQPGEIISDEIPQGETASRENNADPFDFGQEAQNKGQGTYTGGTSQTGQTVKNMAAVTKDAFVDDAEKHTLGMVAMILGIAGLVFAFLTGIVGFILGIVAVVLANKSKRDEGENGMAQAGKITGIIAIVLGAILFVVVIIMLVVLGTVGIGLLSLY